MTQEVFEKAQELKNRLNTLVAIKRLLDNASSRQLAAVTVSRSGVDMHNHEEIPEDVMNRFKDVIAEEIAKAEKEFAEL